jgi:hypothetical protein
MYLTNERVGCPPALLSSPRVLYVSASHDPSRRRELPFAFFSDSSHVPIVRLSLFWHLTAGYLTAGLHKAARETSFSQQALP